MNNLESLARTAGDLIRQGGVNPWAITLESPKVPRRSVRSGELTSTYSARLEFTPTNGLGRVVAGWSGRPGKVARFQARNGDGDHATTVARLQAVLDAFAAAAAEEREEAPTC